MNATSTHDTKRSEDVRARIDALSEFANEWAKSLRHWKRLHPNLVAPGANEQILIYQTMLGAWPIEARRLKGFITKALREGKLHSSWIDINTDYERAVLAFVDSLFKNEAFLKDFLRLQRKLAYFGVLGSIAQLVLKITSPGIPDFYQGTEIWDLSLADPDNRRKVDFSLRRQMLEGLEKHSKPQELLKTWPDGRFKMFVTSKLLLFRRNHPDLFGQGEYIPLRVTGARANHVIAFARRLRDEWCLVAVPRLCASLTRVGSPPVGERVWLDTQIELSPEMATHGEDVLTGNDVSLAPAADLFGSLPFAVCYATDRLCT